MHAIARVACDSDYATFFRYFADTLAGRVDELRRAHIIWAIQPAATTMTYGFRC